MESLIIIVCVTSVLTFILNGWEKHRIDAGLKRFSTILMAIAGVIAPFGSLVGMLLFGNRKKCMLLQILVPIMLILHIVMVYLLRGEIL